MAKVNIQKLAQVIDGRMKNIMKTPINLVLIGKTQDSKMMFSYFVSLTLAN